MQEGRCPNSAEWLKFLSSNITYPDTAVNAEVQGTIRIKFEIEKEGKVSNVEALDGPVILQGEAIRVISLSSGNWQPATMNGRAVKSYKIQPIVFQLKED